MTTSSPSSRALEPLDVEECLTLLGTRFLGRLAYVVDGKPRIVPMNYLLFEGSVIIRMDYGSLLDSVVGTAVAFEVDDVDVDYHTGWSVVVQGKAEEVWEPTELDRMRDLPLRPWAPGSRAHYIRIVSTSMSGRRII